MTYMKSGTDSSTDYLSMYVTGRNSVDAPGTMQASVLVPAGTGQANYHDFSSGGRAGDLSGINVDPSDGTYAIETSDGLRVAGLGRLVDGGDGGDTYNYSPPTDDIVIGPVQKFATLVVWPLTRAPRSRSRLPLLILPKPVPLMLRV